MSGLLLLFCAPARLISPAAFYCCRVRTLFSTLDRTKERRWRVHAIFCLANVFLLFSRLYRADLHVCLDNKMACSAKCSERFRFFCGLSQRSSDAQILANCSALTGEAPAPTGCTEQREKVPCTAAGTQWSVVEGEQSQVKLLLTNSESPHRKGRFVRILKAFSSGCSAFEAVIVLL